MSLDTVESDKIGETSALGTSPEGQSSQAIYPSLRDKHVLITGGGSGIGESFVTAFVEQGARVSFVDIVEEESQALIAKLSPGARHAPKFYPCDLCDLDTLEFDACPDCRGFRGG